MKHNFTLEVPKPCHENWNAFTPTEKGRFCGACQKEVIDFTNWSEDGIKNYFATSHERACGRFNQSQLKSYEAPARPKYSWAAVLALLLLLANRSEAQPKQRTIPQEQLDDKIPFTTNQQTDTTLEQVIIRGFVHDSVDGSAIPGVNIHRKGSSEAAISDSNGNFELTIYQPKPVERLEISFIGFVPVEREVDIAKPFDVKVAMVYDIKDLREKIVVAGIVSVNRFSPRRLWLKAKYFFGR